MIHKAFFYRKSQGGFRGQPRPQNMMAAHEIARDHFDVESGDANIADIKYILRYQQTEGAIEFRPLAVVLPIEKIIREETTHC